MASRKRKIKPSSGASSFFDVLPKLLNGFLLMGAVFNFVAIAWCASNTSPRVVHSLETVCTNYFFTVTQTVERVSSLAGSNVKADSVVLEIPLPYHYMVVDGLPMIRFYGQNYSVGQMTSYGRIESIFPDRVKLEGAAYLKNTTNPDEKEILK